MSKKDEIVGLIEAGLSAPEIVEKTGVTRQYVHQLAKREGIALKPAERPSIATMELSPYRWGRRVSPSWVGAAGELTAAVVLITKGFLVYHAVARTGPFDLIAYKDEKFIRVEVRSIRAKNQKTAIDWGKADLLAKVMPDGEVLWEPFEPN